ncbi:MAG TPA: hypothetical protein PK562_02210, partial [Candidatus Omnitrophota bacterium]|nr:hypothetical protein [Candidatus Omnitrophota bacterium]
RGDMVALLSMGKEFARMHGRKFVIVLYLEGEKFYSLRDFLISQGVDWVLQGTSDQHINFQQILAQPQNYFVLFVSLVPQMFIPGNPAVGFAKGYLDRISPNLVRDYFAQASFEALTQLRQQQGGAGVFVRMKDTEKNRELFKAAFKPQLYPAFVYKPIVYAPVTYMPIELDPHYWGYGKKDGGEEDAFDLYHALLGNGATGENVSDPAQKIMRLDYYDYNDIAMVRSGAIRFCVLTDPEAIEAARRIMQAQPQAYTMVLAQRRSGAIDCIFCTMEFFKEKLAGLAAQPPYDDNSEQDGGDVKSVRHNEVIAEKLMKDSCRFDHGIEQEGLVHPADAVIAPEQSVRLPGSRGPPAVRQQNDFVRIIAPYLSLSRINNPSVQLLAVLYLAFIAFPAIVLISIRQALGLSTVADEDLGPAVDIKDSETHITDTQAPLSTVADDLGPAGNINPADIEKDGGKLAQSAVGYFDTKTKEYVVISRDAPRYYTYLGVKFGKRYLHAIVFTDGSGFTWTLEDPNNYWLTRYTGGGSEEGIQGRYIYLMDMNNPEEYWSASIKPIVKERAKFKWYETRIGFGYLRIISERNGIETEQVIFIPLNKGAPEIQKVIFRNKSFQEKDLMIWSLREFPNGPQDNEKMGQNFTYRNFTTGDKRIIYRKTEFRLKEKLWYEKNQQEWPITFFAVSECPVAVQTSLKGFTGAGDLSCPAWVEDPLLPGNDKSTGGFGVGSHKIRIKLAPANQAGCRKEIIFALGIGKDEEVCWEQAEKWLNPENVNTAFEALKKHVSGKTEKFQCELPDKELEFMANSWLQWQVWANYIFSRSVDKLKTGQSRGMGTRDSWQDIIGYVHLDAAAAKRIIILLLRATHLQNGSAIHAFDVLTSDPKEHDEVPFSDDHLWMILAIYEYIRETNDISILGKLAGYADNKHKLDTVYQHLMKAIEFSWGNFGLLLTADWNDANQRKYKGNYAEGYNRDNYLKKLKKSKAESVMVAMMFLLMCNCLIEISDKDAVSASEKQINKTKHQELIQKAKEEIAARQYWDSKGKYFIAGKDDNGNPFGTSTNVEGRVHLLSQVYAILSGEYQDIEEDCVNAIMSLSRNAGLLLFYPAYDKENCPVGCCYFYPPYFKENGACFVHAASMGITALLKAGRADDAYKVIRAVLPPVASLNDPIKYQSDPHVLSQVVNGENGEEGAGGSWLTGAAAWYLRAVMQFMLGIKPVYDGLVVDPCIPSNWAGYRVKRKFRGKTYYIEILNPDGVSSGVISMQDRKTGNLIPGNIIPYDGHNHNVIVTMGKAGGERKEIRRRLQPVLERAAGYRRQGKQVVLIFDVDKTLLKTGKDHKETIEEAGLVDTFIWMLEKGFIVAIISGNDILKQNERIVTPLLKALAEQGKVELFDNFIIYGNGAAQKFTFKNGARIEDISYRSGKTVDPVHIEMIQPIARKVSIDLWHSVDIALAENQKINEKGEVSHRYLYPGFIFGTRAAGRMSYAWRKPGLELRPDAKTRAITNEPVFQLAFKPVPPEARGSIAAEFNDFFRTLRLPYEAFEAGGATGVTVDINVAGVNKAVAVNDVIAQIGPDALYIYHGNEFFKGGNARPVSEQVTKSQLEYIISVDKEEPDLTRTDCRMIWMGSETEGTREWFALLEKTFDGGDKKTLEEWAQEFPYGLNAKGFIVFVGMIMAGSVGAGMLIGSFPAAAFIILAIG